MTYEEAVKYLNSFIQDKKSKWNKNFGLEKILFLLNKVDNPHLGLKYVHVGGTAGKGSTGTILASILKESGYKTGLHVSPHMVSIRERAQVNGKNISKKRFTQLVEHLTPIVKNMRKEFGASPSYYELLLVITFLYFKEEKTDINVIEVGLGGKLDSTNVIDCHYQIITNIGLDHTAILGPTKEHIIRDKQEIIKKNSIVVSGIQEENLKDILKEKVKSTNSQLYLLNENFYPQNIKINKEEKSFDLFIGNETLKDLPLKLNGDFQITNASLAATMAKKMQNEFKQITTETIKNGLKAVQIKGRFETLSQEPLIIVDGAHNPMKIQALVDSIQSAFPGKKFITIFRYKKRSDILESLNLIQSTSELIIITGSKVPGDMGLDKVYTKKDLKELKDFTFEAIKDAKYAFRKAKFYQSKNPHLGILATGSIFMLRELMAEQDT